MSIRSSLLLSFSFLWGSSAFVAAAADMDTQDVSFDKPVQIPEGVLQPGKYTIRLEDRMADRAIVRITEPGGTDHYLLTVPSKTLKSGQKGLIFFPESTGTEALNGWQCGGCKRPLEFVYPKDEAVKLTADTGKPILAYDASYDKLPANLSPADRRVVTLWLLAPKTVTAAGKGEGLTAAKYSAPKVVASAEPLPKTMPKTGSSAFLELLAGFISFVAGAIAFLWRKLSALPKIWKMAGLTAISGMVAGFALPIASSYQTGRIYVPPSSEITAVHVRETQTAQLRAASEEPKLLEVPTALDRDSEVERLRARNRRLEALLATLRQRDERQ